MERESMQFDVLIIGGGPAGLSAAIRLRQLNQNISVGLIDKAATIGGHILSGAVIEPRAVDELIPNWRKLETPLNTPAKTDRFLLLTANQALTLPTPPQMHNKGNYIISLDNFCRWLSQQAETLGVQIFPGFAGKELILDQKGKVCGVTTGDVGLDKQSKPTTRFQPGVNLYAKQTLLAEGCYGSLTKKLSNLISLREPEHYQSYAIGIKELWRVNDDQHKPGMVIHSVGWPLSTDTYGGSFIYHWGVNLVSVGFVVGLDYRNPFLDPFEEFQRFKTHPAIRKTFEDGARIGYGARALSEGGWQAIPKLTFPGGMLIGDCAGFLNVPKIKGIHTAMKSGMVAAETIAANLSKDIDRELTDYNEAIKRSWINEELYLARNIRPGFKKGLWAGLLYSALDTYVLRGKAPWTFNYTKPDYAYLKKAAECKPIIYPKPDGKLTFNKLDSVFSSNTFHNEHQPSHLQFLIPKDAIDVNYRLYASPETRYCPAGVYEITLKDGQPHLQINASNCVHCKTCDIKDPEQNINWEPPEGGDGPNYIDM